MNTIANKVKIVMSFEQKGKKVKKKAYFEHKNEIFERPYAIKAEVQRLITGRY